MSVDGFLVLKFRPLKQHRSDWLKQSSIDLIGWTNRVAYVMLYWRGICFTYDAPYQAFVV